MKKRVLLILIFLGFTFAKSNAQIYETVSYALNGTPNNGVCIKTNLPFTNSSQMVTLRIEGYNYNSSDLIGINLGYYIYNNTFYNASITSWGSYTPEIYLLNNNGLVNVYINDKPYFQRFKVTAFAKGLAETSPWFQGWTVADEVMTGTAALKLNYKNKLGNLYASGVVGIGTSDTKGYKLAVNGKIRAQEIKVESANWPDYVFSKSYSLTTLEETEKHIKEKGHLPGIPSAADVKSNGIDLGEMNAKLLQKIEELTLYLIEKDKQIISLTKDREVDQLENSKRELLLRKLADRIQVLEKRNEK